MASPQQPESVDVKQECVVCYENTSSSNNENLAIVELASCNCRRTCRTCFITYLRTEISEGRINLTCPECPEHLHPSDVQRILAHYEKNDASFFKYEEFMIRRVLAREEPDARWCPAPDCNYAVIASGCASCPRLECQREACGTAFCYNCKQLWHPDSPCNLFSAAASIFSGASTSSTAAQTTSAAAHSVLQALPRSILKHADPTSNLGLIKPCPTCQALIAKTEDGSCNHMTCAMCGTDFCWLCLKAVSDLHFLSPSGCTFWGKRPWSRKKKLWCQIGTLIGAPVGIALVAGLAIPAILVGVPVFTGRKIFRRMEKRKKWKRNTAVTLGVVGAAVGAPLAAVFAVGVGVPCMVAYVYGVVPFALVRNSLANANSNNGTNNNNNNNTVNKRSGSSLEIALEKAEQQEEQQKIAARIIAVDEHGRAVILNKTSNVQISAENPDVDTIVTIVDETANSGPPKKTRFFSNLLRRSNRSAENPSTSFATKSNAAAQATTSSSGRTVPGKVHHKNRNSTSSCGCHCHENYKTECIERVKIDTNYAASSLSTSISDNHLSTSPTAGGGGTSMICNSCGCGASTSSPNQFYQHHHRASTPSHEMSSNNNSTYRCFRQQSTTTMTTASSNDTRSYSNITSANVSLCYANGCNGSMQGVSSLTGKKRCCSNVMTTVTHEEPKMQPATTHAAQISSSVVNDSVSMNGLAGSLACAKCGVAGVAAGSSSHVRLSKVRTSSTQTAARDSQSYAGCLEHTAQQHRANHDAKSEACACGSLEIAGGDEAKNAGKLNQGKSYESNEKNSSRTGSGVLMLASGSARNGSSSMIRKARAGDSVSVTALSRDDGLSVNEDVLGNVGVFKYLDNEILSVGSGSKKSDVK